MNAVAALGQEHIQPALTTLSEEEELFRSSVREFAEGEVRPRVEKMEHDAKLDKDLIKQCFELGLMAIETPEEYGGAGSWRMSIKKARMTSAKTTAIKTSIVKVQPASSWKFSRKATAPKTIKTPVTRE